MNKARETVVWVCVFSILFMGCYTSTLVNPTGHKREELDSGNIEYVVTNDGSKFVFDSSPTVSENAIVGMSNHKAVSIPLSEVRRVYLTRLDPMMTSGVILTIVVAAGMIVYLAYLEAAHDVWH
jgi:hypothetical protein